MNCSGMGRVPGDSGLSHASVHAVRSRRAGFPVSALDRTTPTWERWAMTECGATRPLRGFRAEILADDSIVRALRGHVPGVPVVGEALAPGRSMHGTLEGARAAMAI